jgi:hypothetical protein
MGRMWGESFSASAPGRVASEQPATVTGGGTMFDGNPLLSCEHDTLERASIRSLSWPKGVRSVRSP